MSGMLNDVEIIVRTNANAPIVIIAGNNAANDFATAGGTYLAF